MAVLIVPKLRLTSNITHIIDFCSRIISLGGGLYRLVDGSIEEHVVFESAAQNL
jgi:hypothetical protein